MQAHFIMRLDETYNNREILTKDEVARSEYQLKFAR